MAHTITIPINFNGVRCSIIQASSNGVSTSWCQLCSCLWVGHRIFMQWLLTKCALKKCQHFRMKQNINSHMISLFTANTSESRNHL